MSVMFRKSVVIEEALDALHNGEHSELKVKVLKFAVTTTIGGLPQAARSKHPVARLLWLAVVALSTVAMGYHIYELISYFLQMNTTVNVEVIIKHR